jgi:excinuclease UvrABC nuclease subunit
MDQEAERRALQAEMAAAAEAGDFERAAALRDRLRALAQTSKLRRLEPGKMGLGTDQQAMAPPKGWTAPKRPDPMTSTTKPRRGGR